MGKRYFSHKRKQDPSLYRIIFVLCLLLVGLYVVSAVYVKFQDRRPVRQVDSGAQSVLEEARSLIAAGELNQAEEVISPLITKGDQMVAPQAMILQADIHLQSGQDDAALALLQRVNERYPASPDRPEAAAKYARLLEKRGQHDEALALYEEIVRTAPPALRAEGTLGLARRAERRQELEQARELYARALHEAVVDVPVWEEAAEALGRLNTAAIFSTEPTGESKLYTVESGDTLTSIGIKLNTTQGLLTRANGISEDVILRLGQKLKYTPKDFRIVIERSSCRLFLMDKDGLFKVYRVGLGMPGSETALGRYTIGNKQKDPTWFKPGAEPIPPNDPRNELGTRWMPLVPVGDGPDGVPLPTDLGIHGTIAPETVGGYVSNGCARLLNEEVEELYDLVVRSTPVEIVEHAAKNLFSTAPEELIAARSA